MSTAVLERTAVGARPDSVPSGGAVPPWVLPAIVVFGGGLRVWRASSNGLSFDETFTAMAGRRSFGDLLSYLRHFDSHPPLDYLIRAPLARAGASDFALRAPSVVFSCAALALFAWWMRDREWFGVIATAIFAVSSFQLIHGGEARMYALLELLGVAAVVVADRWLRSPRPWHAAAIGGILLVALFDHVSGALLAAGLLAVAGVRRDREAWRWRAAVAVVGSVWLVVWGPVLRDQLRGQWASWIPPTTPTRFAETVARQLTSAGASEELLVLVGVVTGGVLLLRRDAVLARLWLALGVLPFVLAAVIGAFAAFLFDRTLTLASWAPIVALAYALDEARRRARLFGVALVVFVVGLLLLASYQFPLNGRWDYDLSVDRLQQVARPGDVLAVRPARYGILVDWRIGVRDDPETRQVDLAAMDDVDGLLVAGAAPSGRVWLLTPLGSPVTFPGYQSCGGRWSDGETEVVCLRRAPGHPLLAARRP